MTFGVSVATPQVYQRRAMLVDREGTTQFHTIFYELPAMKFR